MSEISKMTLLIRQQVARRRVMAGELTPAEMNAWIRSETLQHRFTVLPSGRVIEHSADESPVAESGS